MRAELKSPGPQFDMVALSAPLEVVTRAVPADTNARAEYWRERYDV